MFISCFLEDTDNLRKLYNNLLDDSQSLVGARLSHVGASLCFEICSVAENTISGTSRIQTVRVETKSRNESETVCIVL